MRPVVGDSGTREKPPFPPKTSRLHGPHVHRIDGRSAARRTVQSNGLMVSFSISGTRKRMTKVVVTCDFGRACEDRVREVGEHLLLKEGRQVFTCEPGVVEGCDNEGGISNYEITKRRRYEAVYGRAKWPSHAGVAVGRMGNTCLTHHLQKRTQRKAIGQ